MNQLQTEIGEWGVATFGKNQTPKALISHIVKETIELQLAHNLENEIEECSDIFILLCGIAHQRGFDLMQEARNKFEVIKKRKWGEPDSEGVIQHVKERQGGC